MLSSSIRRSAGRVGALALMGVALHFAPVVVQEASRAVDAVYDYASSWSSGYKPPTVFVEPTDGQLEVANWGSGRPKKV